jgi:hypothetical protein
MPGVTITVNNSGDFAYSAALLHVGAGDVITWNAGSETGAFAIKFRPDTPLEVGGVALESGGPANTIVGTVKGGLAKGAVYYYSVRAAHLPDGKIWTDGGCPELIVK